MNRFEKLRALPCCGCHAPPPSDVAHANWAEMGKGMGKKADDEYTIPLCRQCHYNLDAYVWQTRDEAKAWFLRKLEFVNQVLAEQDMPSEYLF